jgi:hypothetical protein
LSSGWFHLRRKAQNGRVVEIVEAIHLDCGPGPVDAATKLAYLCDAIAMSPSELDELIASNSPVRRTVAGHVWEVVFDDIMALNGKITSELGGDTNLDRRLDDLTLQLKTPTKQGTTRTTVAYKTHKTHGAKSEEESMDYYSTNSAFADFLVGLVSYRPFQVMVIPRDALPTHPLEPGKILSPFKMEFVGSPHLNAFESLGVPRLLLPDWLGQDLPDQGLLPKTCKILGVPERFVIDAILRPENFRIWDMNILGFAREAAYRARLEAEGKTIFSPDAAGKTRSDKSDLALQKVSGEFDRMQVKGLTLGACRFAGPASTVSIETQLSRGRVNDHPTQSRLYLTTDWEWLGVSIEPPVEDRLRSELGLPGKGRWGLYAIPVQFLACHGVHQTRLKSMQVLRFADLQGYAIGQDWLSRFR